MALLIFLTCHAHALVTYDNAQDDPAHNTTTAGLPSGLADAWEAVVFVEPSPFAYNASAVYLGNGFFLTARHVNAVNPWQAQVAINRVSYQVDTAFGVGGVLNVEDIPGIDHCVDLKIFKVHSPPNLPPVTLNRKGKEAYRKAYLIGCGQGKGAAVAGQGWAWGSNATRAKRWGLSKIIGMGMDEKEAGVFLVSQFSPSLGPNVATGAMGDSGSGVFQNIGGTWVLSGITIAVTTNEVSYYAPDPHETFYVRVANYADAILSAMTETTIGPVVIPNLWFRTYFPTTPFDTYAALATQPAANGVNTVADCYVAGLNPTNAASHFHASIAFSNNAPHISWSPDLGLDRTYQVLGKTNLTDTCWCPTNNATRFFKVRVEMK